MRENKIVKAMGNMDDKYLNEAINYQPKKRNRFNGWAKLITMAACVCFMIGGGLIYSDYYQVDSVVAIDVNPSVEIRVSKTDKVLAVIPLNEDAKVVLEGMDLKGVDLDVALNAIIGSMATNGYLDNAYNSINICVENKNIARGEQLGEKISAEINGLLDDKDLIGKAVSTACEVSAEVEAGAAEYGVSVGKYLLAVQVSEATGMAMEDAVLLCIDELWDLVDAEEAEIISKAEALQLACEDAGITEENIKLIRNKISEKNGEWTYKIEFLANENVLHKYKIDALDGSILAHSYEYVELEVESEPADTEDTTEIGTEETTEETTEAVTEEATEETTEVTTEESTDAVTEETEEETTEETVAPSILSKKEILAIVYADAGVEEKDVRLEEMTLQGANLAEYRVEFSVGRCEYVYLVNSYDGTIIHKEKEEYGCGKEHQGQKPEKPKATITEEEALNIAYTDAGINTEDVTNLDVKFKNNPIKAEYRIKFCIGRDMYDYLIDATNGEILHKWNNIKNEIPENQRPEDSQRPENGQKPEDVQKPEDIQRPENGQRPGKNQDTDNNQYGNWGDKNGQGNQEGQNGQNGQEGQMSPIDGKNPGQNTDGNRDRDGRNNQQDNGGFRQL